MNSRNNYASFAINSLSTALNAKIVTAMPITFALI